jgi:hypothetical protein
VQNQSFTYDTWVTRTPSKPPQNILTPSIVDFRISRGYASTYSRRQESQWNARAVEHGSIETDERVARPLEKLAAMNQPQLAQDIQQQINKTWLR